MYRKLLIKYKIHFASFAKPLHFLCKKAKLVVLGGDIVAFALSFCDFLSCLDARNIMLILLSC